MGLSRWCFLALGCDFVGCGICMDMWGPWGLDAWEDGTAILREHPDVWRQ